MLTNKPLIIAIVLVHMHPNFLAISLSGNISGTSLVKWSAAENDKLCFAMNSVKRDSAFVT